MKKHLQTLHLSIHYDETYQITGDERVIQFNQKSGLQLTYYSIATLSKFIQFLELPIKYAHFITDVYTAYGSKDFFDEVDADIISCTSAIIEKIPMIGKDLTELSLETVKMFYQDGRTLGFSIL